MNTDSFTTLLEKMSAGEIAPSRSELLAQLAEGDPRMAALAKYFAQREAEQLVVPDQEEPKDRAPERKRESFQRLQRLMKQIYAELETLRERNDSLAAALGACYLCWGEDPLCALCGGTGAPGADSPDRALFAHYISPVLGRVRSKRLATLSNSLEFTQPDNNNANNEEKTP
jgi:hypothetical protein